MLARLLLLLPLLPLFAASHPTAPQPARRRHRELAKRYTPPTPSVGPVTGQWSVNSDAYHRLSNMLPTILTNAISITTHSWELGALTQALLEVYDPNLSPFEFNSGAFNTAAPDAFIQVTLASIANYDWSGCPSWSGTGQVDDLTRFLWQETSPTPLQYRPLVNGDGSLGDPASLGAAVWLVAEMAHRNDLGSRYGLRPKEDYAWAVGNQLRYLLEEPSRSSNSTISMRENHFEVWSDMGYMIPPFLSYLGATTQTHNLLTISLEQYQLEASALYDPSRQLYRHVNSFDPRSWGTGNGWMAMGMMRTLAATFAAGEAGVLWDRIGPMEGEIAGVFASLFRQLNDENLIPNYMFETDSSLIHGESASTALVVAAYYRFRKLAPWLTTDEMNQACDRAFDGVMAKVDDNGWMTQVVDPLGSNGFLVYPENDSLRSPEGQAFLGMMWAARTAAAR